jgi:hypothetical protein
MNRRHFLATTASILAMGPVFAQDTPTLQVAKTPTCGCCSAWVERMQDAGFVTEVQDVEQEALWTMKDRLGITQELSGCHTAVVSDYFVEGHVPAADIQRMLAEAPAARGLAVPGMPMGSPGMGAMGTGDPFDVLLVLNDGSTQVFASYA